MELTDMNFRVDHSDFADAVAWVAHNIPSHPLEPILAGVLLTANDEGLTINGFDYEISTEVTIPAEVVDNGSVVVSGKLLADITRSLPKDTATVNVDGAKLHISCGNARFTLPTMPVEDYPNLPNLPTKTGSIPVDVFVDAVKQVAIAAGKDDSIPMLTGIRMEINDVTVTLAATDRFRLAVRTFEWDPFAQFSNSAVLIPSKMLSETAKTFAATSTAPVELALGGTDEELGGEGLLGIVGENRRTTTRLLDAQFPPFRTLLPQSHTAIATMDIAPLAASIKRVSLVSDRGAQVRLAFANGEVVLTAGGDDSGEAEETLPVRYWGEPMTIAFNPSYVLDGLSVIEDTTVTFGFTNPNRPAIIIPGITEEPDTNNDGEYISPDTDYTYLLMPVRLPG